MVNSGTGEKPPYTYTGKERDRSGLMYYGARYYDPAFARFITPDKVTLLGTASMIGLGVAGLDLPADIRDTFHTLTPWQWTWGHAGKTLVDGIGVLPVLGVLKYADEVGALAKSSTKASPLFGVYEYDDWLVNN